MKLRFKCNHVFAVTAIAYAIFFLPILANAQAGPQGERNLAGSLIDLDYFEANYNPETKHQLFLVNRAHASETTWKQFFAGKYEVPIADCQYVFRYFPNHPGALHLISEIAKATRQDSLAIGYFERALELFPQHAYTHAQYGHFLVDVGAVSAGIAELSEALRLEPDNIQARAWLEEALPAKPSGALGPSQTAKADSVGLGAGPVGQGRGD